MPDYRIEVRDSRGAIQARIDLSCVNDAEAIDKARELDHSGDVAILYQGLRPVTAFKRKRERPTLESHALHG